MGVLRSTAEGDGVFEKHYARNAALAVVYSDADVRRDVDGSGGSLHGTRRRKSHREFPVCTLDIVVIRCGIIGRLLRRPDEPATGKREAPMRGGGGKHLHNDVAKLPVQRTL